MINLNIPATEKMLEVITVSYTTEDILFALERKTEDECLQRFIKFCDDSLEQFDEFVNLINEVYSVEGFVDAAKDVIIRFVKWLWRTLTYLGKKIMELFGFTKKEGDAPEAIASRIMVKESRNMELSKLRQHSTKDSLVSIGLSSDANIQTLENCCKRALVLIGAACNLRPEYTVNPMETLSNLDKLLSDILEEFENGDCVVESSRAYDYICKASEYAIQFRGYACALSSELKELPLIKMDRDYTREEANDLLDKLFKRIDPNEHILHRSTIEDDMRFVRTHILVIRAMCTSLYKIDRRITRDVVSVVSQMSIIDSDHNGGVDFSVKVPQTLIEKMRSAWKYDFVINRLVVSNSRGVRRCTSGSDAVQGQTSSSRLLNRELSSKEVVINYNYFKNELKFCISQREFREVCELTDNFNNAEALDVSYDRIDWFLVTLVHECRHLVQDQFGIKKKDVNVDLENEPDAYTKYEKYLKLEHETDARKAAAEFKQHITDEDRQWVKRILSMGLKLEHRNILKQLRNQHEYTR